MVCRNWVEGGRDGDEDARWARVVSGVKGKVRKIKRYRT